ncbi:MAG: ribulose-phosphate 3-epimerase [Bacteroidales bacterium]|nr:ribulose-phosphate 3-epimerase [Bacteroidales bacterium]
MPNKFIAPSLLSADFIRLESEISMINSSEADYLHLDIMDGVFVPNITFGWPIIEQINQICTKPLDVHLMIVQPERYIQQFINAGAHFLTVHLEASTHLHRTLTSIREAGAKAGVSINPHTPVSALSEVLDLVDLVLIMSVNPGFGGQSFIKNSLEKIKQLSQMRKQGNHSFLIEVDGGVNLENANLLFDAGAEILVAGNAVFKSENPSETIILLKYRNL